MFITWTKLSSLFHILFHYLSVIAQISSKTKNNLGVKYNMMQKKHTNDKKKWVKKHFDYCVTYQYKANPNIFNKKNNNHWDFPLQMIWKGLSDTVHNWRGVFEVIISFARGISCLFLYVYFVHLDHSLR